MNQQEKAENWIVTIKGVSKTGNCFFEIENRPIGVRIMTSTYQLEEVEA